jgi:flagellar motor switch protein FliN/FliY
MSEETTPDTGSALEQAVDEATEAIAIQANELPELGVEGAAGQPIGLDGVLSVPVRLTVRIGQAQMTLADLVKLGPGTLVPLDRDAHEPADIFVNGRLVARGEIVTVDSRYAIRVSEISKD